MLNQKRYKKLLFIIITIIVLAIICFIILHGQHYFSRRIIRQLQGQIRSFGILSPLVVVFLIFLSTIIPPLPLPVPLVEIASGLVFNFAIGFLLVWFSQIGSSLMAFSVSRYFGKRFFKNILNNHVWIFYRQYLHQKGPLAVFIIRLTMAAPFNIISYLAGLTEMKITNFAVATTLGTIPEAVLFVFIGTKLRSVHFSLWYLFIFTIILGSAGSLITFIVVKFLQPKQPPEVKSI